MNGATASRVPSLQATVVNTPVAMLLELDVARPNSLILRDVDGRNLLRSRRSYGASVMELRVGRGTRESIGAFVLRSCRAQGCCEMSTWANRSGTGTWSVFALRCLSAEFEALHYGLEEHSVRKQAWVMATVITTNGIKRAVNLRPSGAFQTALTTTALAGHSQHVRERVFAGGISWFTTRTYEE